MFFIDSQRLECEKKIHSAEKNLNSVIPHLEIKTIIAYIFVFLF